MTRPSRKTTSFVGSVGAAPVEAARVVKNKVAKEQQTKATGEYDVLLAIFTFWNVGAMKKHGLNTNALQPSQRKEEILVGSGALPQALHDIPYD
jgi:hypothetical protein